jgi:hypothetical protein
MAPLQKKPGEKEDKELNTTDYSPRPNRINRINRRERVQESSNQFDPGSILQEAKNVDFRQKEDADSFKRKYNDYLLGRIDTGTSRDNVLHLLADNKDRWSDERIQTFLDWLLKEYHGLLEKKDKLGYAPLFRALIDDKHAFVNAVLSFPGLKNLGAVLKLTCDKGNILHVAIDNDSPFIKTIVEKCKSYPAIFMQGDNDRDTPLHRAVATDVSQKDLEGVLQRNKLLPKDPSPAQLTVETILPVRRVGTSSQGSRQPKPHILSPTDPTPADWTLVDGEPRYSSRRCSPLEIVKRLVEACPSALSHKNNEGETPYRCREYVLFYSATVNDTVNRILDKAATENDKNTPEKATPEELREIALRQIFVEDPMASHIREYCMCNLARDEIMRCLYQPGQGELDRDSHYKPTLIKCHYKNVTSNSTWPAFRIQISRRLTSNNWRITYNLRAF